MSFSHGSDSQRLNQLASLDMPIPVGLFDGLDVNGEDFVPLQGQDYNTDFIKSFALRLGRNLRTYDNMLAAGRIILFDINRACGKAEEYADIMSHRLWPSTYQFFMEHSDEINADIERNRDDDYRKHDLFSASTLVKTYMTKPTVGEEPWETPQQMHYRTAIFTYTDQGFERVRRCKDNMSKGFYTPASPTIFNAGTKKPQTSSCFLLKIGDNLPSILQTGVYYAGQISASNGGLGIDMSLMRHSQIGDGGMASGVVPAGRVYDRAIKYVDQGGKRDGAGTAFLKTFHIDVQDFIKATDNFTDHTQRFFTMNICLWNSRLFFKKVANNEPWYTFCPAKAKKLQSLYGYELEEVYEEQVQLAIENERNFEELKIRLKQLKNDLLADPSNEGLRKAYRDSLKEMVQARRDRVEHKKIDRASDLLDLIAKNQMASSMPYMMHGDACNWKNNQKHMGPIDGSNLCLEIIEYTTPEKIASCNLGSHNVPSCVIKPWDHSRPFAEQIQEVYDWGTFGEKSMDLVEDLDTRIDLNYYPLDEYDKSGKLVKAGPIRTLNEEMRPLGIGCSGLADAFLEMDLCYDGPEAEYFNKVYFAAKYFNELCKTVELAAQKGTYPMYREGSFKTFEGVKVDDKGKKHVVYGERKGSPFSNGILQMDLWNEEAEMLEQMGDLYKLYDRKDDIAVEPHVWGQKPYTFEFKDTEGKVQSYTIEPTWNAVREALVKIGARNSMLGAIMPTASTANIFRNAESTEPYQANVFTRDIISGSYLIVNRHLEKDLRAIGCWSEKLLRFIMLCKGSVKHMINYILDHPEEFPRAFDEKGELNCVQRLAYLLKKYKTTYEISQKCTTMMARQRGIYVDQSQSLNIYLEDPKDSQLKAIHAHTSGLGLKTGMYYLRQDPTTFIGSFSIDVDLTQYYKAVTGEESGAPAPSSPEMKEQGEVLPEPPSGSDGDQKGNTVVAEVNDDGVQMCRFIPGKKYDPGCVSCQ